MPKQSTLEVKKTSVRISNASEIRTLKVSENDHSNTGRLGIRWFTVDYLNETDLSLKITFILTFIILSSWLHFGFVYILLELHVIILDKDMKDR